MAVAVQKSELFRDANGRDAPLFFSDPANAIEVAVDTASAASAVINADTDQAVELVATVPGYFTCAAAPTAVNGAGSTYLPANVIRGFVVPKGMKLAFIKLSGSGAGVANITKCQRPA